VREGRKEGTYVHFAVGNCKEEEDCVGWVIFFVLKVVYAESLVEGGFVIWQEIQAEAKAGGCLRPNISITTREFLISLTLSTFIFVHL
jgi:hypothetical protein